MQVLHSASRLLSLIKLRVRQFSHISAKSEPEVVDIHKQLRNTVDKLGKTSGKNPVIPVHSFVAIPLHQNSFKNMRHVRHKNLVSLCAILMRVSSMC